jgi:hypothetical protein
VRAKSIEVGQDIDREPLLYVRGTVHLKNIEVEWDVDREPLAFLCAALHV